MTNFQNQATLSFLGGNVVSNIVNGELTSEITATKIAVTDRYTQNDDVTYHIVISNAGISDYNGISVTDNLGAYLQDTETRIPLTYVPGSAHLYRNGVKQESPTPLPGTALVFNGLTIPARGNILLAYEVKVNEYAPLTAGSSITNKAIVAGGGLSDSIEVTETITVEDYIRLHINKAISPSVVVENGTLTYTFNISNSGNREATADDVVAIRDIFAPVLSDITVMLGTRQAVLGVDYNYNQTTGLFTTVERKIVVPAATFIQGEDGVYGVDPGDIVLTVTGTV